MASTAVEAGKKAQRAKDLSYPALPCALLLYMHRDTYLVEVL